MAQDQGGIPYIGSLIALTSASGQRYKGTLYTVDLNESTIALQNGAMRGRKRLRCLDILLSLDTPAGRLIIFFCYCNSDSGAR